jgi:hypothetical protein
MSPYFQNLANEKGTKENGNFCLFAANGKRKRQTSVCLLQTVLFQQTCPSMTVGLIK